MPRLLPSARVARARPQPPETLTKQRDVLIRFVRGLHRAQLWMAASTAQEIAAVVAPVFGTLIQ